MLKFKVVVPKGTLDPNVNNVIEIPRKYEDANVVVASTSLGGINASLPRNMDGFHPNANSTFTGAGYYSSLGQVNSTYGVSNMSALMSGGVDSSGVSCPCPSGNQYLPPRPATAPRSHLPSRQAAMRSPSPRVQAGGQMAKSGASLYSGMSQKSLGIESLEDEMLEMDKLEYVERENVKEDVLNYLKSRRKLIFGLVTMEMAKAKKASKKWKKRMTK